MSRFRLRRGAAPQRRSTLPAPAQFAIADTNPLFWFDGSANTSRLANVERVTSVDNAGTLSISLSDTPIDNLKLIKNPDGLQSEKATENDGSYVQKATQTSSLRVDDFEFFCLVTATIHEARGYIYSNELDFNRNGGAFIQFTPNQLFRVGWFNGSGNLESFASSRSFKNGSGPWVFRVKKSGTSVTGWCNGREVLSGTAADSNISYPSTTGKTALFRSVNESNNATEAHSGTIRDVLFYDTLSTDDAAKVQDTLAKKSLAIRKDVFASDGWIDVDNTTATRTENRLSLSASNPLFGPNRTASEDDPIHPCVRLIDGTWKMWYRSFEIENGRDVAAHARYAESTDGVNWTFPDLGQVSINGSTSNNALALGTPNEESNLGLWVYYDDANDTYVGVSSEHKSDITLYIVESSDGINWSLVKSIEVQSAYFGDPNETKSIHRRADGRWVIVIRENNNTIGDRRQPGFLISDTTDYSGSYTMMGQGVGTYSENNQQYRMSFNDLTGRGQYWTGFIPRYRFTNDDLPALEYFASRDGYSHNRGHDALLASDVGSWGNVGVYEGTIVNDGAGTWHVYFTGEPTNHDTLPNDFGIGLATVREDGLVQYDGAGDLITEAVWMDGESLSINATASGSTLDVEVQNPDGSVVSGYAASDFNTITSDGTDVSGSWSGKATLPSGLYKLRFVLGSGATLYSYDAS